MNRDEARACAAALRKTYDAIGKTEELSARLTKLDPAPDLIVIKRDRAKYNAYMRAYRAKKKAAKP